jgi:hypothetical protein
VKVSQALKRIQFQTTSEQPLLLNHHEACTKATYLPEIGQFRGTSAGIFLERYLVVRWNNSGGGVVLTIFTRNDLCFLTTKRYIQELHIFQGSDSILEPLLVLFERHLVVALNTRSDGAILVVFTGQNQFNF